MKGRNFFRHTCSNGEIFVGEIKGLSVGPKEKKNIEVMSLTALWIVRIRKAVDVSVAGDSTAWQPIPETKRTNYCLKFEHPQLIQERSPLAFSSSEGDRVEITHLTKLGEIVLNIRDQLENP